MTVRIIHEFTSTLFLYHGEDYLKKLQCYGERQWKEEKDTYAVSCSWICIINITVLMEENKTQRKLKARALAVEMGIPKWLKPFCRV